MRSCAVVWFDIQEPNDRTAILPSGSPSSPYLTVSDVGEGASGPASSAIQVEDAAILSKMGYKQVL